MPDEKPFTLNIGDNRLVVKPVKGEPGVSHHLIINNELHRCDFRLPDDKGEKHD
jgi:hypothetical protein